MAQLMNPTLQMETTMMRTSLSIQRVSDKTRMTNSKSLKSSPMEVEVPIKFFLTRLTKTKEVPTITSLRLKTIETELMESNTERFSTQTIVRIGI